MSSRLRIAIADDEAFIRRYFQEILPDLGHEVVVAAQDGGELVERCKATQPDLVISDIKMPNMDGIEAAIEISRLRPVPIILVSAYHDPDLIDRAAASGVMAYLVKPIERSDLQAAIAVARKRFEQIDSLERQAEELRQALEDRKLVERAKGIIMKRLGLDEQQAIRKLQRLASDKNLKLAEVARKILAAESAWELFD